MSSWGCKLDISVDISDVIVLTFFPKIKMPEVPYILPTTACQELLIEVLSQCCKILEQPARIPDVYTCSKLRQTDKPELI